LFCSFDIRSCFWFWIPNASSCSCRPNVLHVLRRVQKFLVWVARDPN
jgi:hypothetical protein